ncbi:MAG: DUF4458 domain-containing protein [Alistipes sp.]|nr:DUF4458 domain-containing protein [Alistipes sp.]
MKNILRHIWLVVLAAIVASSCQREAESLEADYGYVQLRLQRSTFIEGTSATRATDRLEWLADAHKITVIMQHDGSTITQTLLLSYYDRESAEWGVSSEKLRLLTGSYNIIGYYLYDNLDQELYIGEGAGAFTIVKGGLTVKDVGVDVVKRGKVSFFLAKLLATRSEAGAEYPFSSIRSVDISVKHKTTKETFTFKGLTTTYYEAFVEGAMDKELYDSNGLTSFMVCSGVHWLEAGDYTITRYTTYSDTKGQYSLERDINIESLGATFTLGDCEIKQGVVVPIKLDATAEHIKDYEALKEIWLALDGPNWSFYGDEYGAGANWNFNKDKDMWGDQPGITLNAAGRVETLNISGFGARGVVPEAIGQLTDLKLLYLGNHNELIGGYDATRLDAKDYYHRVLECDAREGLSAELKHSLGIAESKGMTENMGIARRPERKDVAFGNLTNGITSISRAVMRLTKLEQLFIANSPITTDGFFVDIAPESKYYAEREEWSWSNFTNLTDVEIYNCSQLVALPRELITELPNLQSLNVAVNFSISGEQLKADWEALIDGASGDDIQILYLGFNNLRETPSHDYMKRMSKIGLLDCTNNRLETVHPFGKEVSPATLLFDNNQITRIYAAEDGYFCGLSLLEEISCAGNLLTELPDIFTARSIYGMLTANFSSNRISSLENGEAWRGINTSTLNLADNRFEELPKRIIGSGSSIETLMLSSNGIRRIEEGALVGANSESLRTIDLSFNRLTELPYHDFSISNIPFLYGIDLSSNAFSEFPYAPLSVDRLTVMSIRQQRDDEGNRTLREWPTGLYTHPGLSAFYIGSNDLRKIDDTISPYILLFEIKDNPNISIDLSSVCPYIEMGYYELIYDSTQDIRGCDALNLD